jgi:hypothetical protein
MNYFPSSRIFVKVFAMMTLIALKGAIVKRLEELASS